MKTSYLLTISIVCLSLQNLFLSTTILAADRKETSNSLVHARSPSNGYLEELEKYTKYAEVVSAGYNNGSRVLIRIGGHTFYDYRGPRVGLAGLYVVAMHENEVLLQYHYNTYFLGGASLGFSRDISKLPYGTFVVVAAKGEPTRLFDEQGQKALYSIGAGTGLLNQKFRTSYLCVGVKGLARGKAIEKIGSEELKHLGEKAGEQINLVFPKKEEPQGLSREPGKHEGLMFGDTEVIYYIPESFNPDTAQYLFGIHGAGAWHRPGALTRIAQFSSTADKKNIVIIAPAFDCIFNRPPDRKRDIEMGKFKDPRIIKDRYLWNFIMLLNNFNEHRTDMKLIEIFDFFNQKLMKREKFYLDGHSGGGQFVARFVLFHPELIKKAAICSAGSFVFPHRDKDYPYGLKLDNLEKTFGPQIRADDLELEDEQIDQKLNQMLDLKIFIIAGEEETYQENRPERNWQGKSTLEKAKNFYKAMREEDKRLKQKGLRSLSKPYQYELHIIPNVGHNSHETAQKASELLFPTNEKASKAHANERYISSIAEKGETTSTPEHPDKSLSKYVDTLKKYAKRTKVISGGYRSGNRVLIQIDDHPFYINMPDGPDTAGLYVVAIHKNKVLLISHYNTFKRQNASKQMANDITKLPNGTFVVVAAKDEPTRFFDKEGQKALYQIGAEEGLLNQELRISYFCLGVKGLKRGKAIEKAGLEMLEYTGSDVSQPVKLVFTKKEKAKVTAGIFKIYNPSIGEKETWFINDHCFVRSSDGTWHMFGITQTHPHNPIYGSIFAYATAKNLTQIPWDKKSFALKADPKSKEVHLWAPHIILHNGTYHMYYCAGANDRTKYKIHLATSKDFEKWQRHPKNPMIVDGFDARDPFILKVGNDWVMYYTATSKPSGGNHVVACQTSRDLIHWSNRRIVFKDPSKGKSGGPTESPTVVRRGKYYYLFIGPRGGYVGTDVFRSENPFRWELKDHAGHIRAHAAEVIRDVDGKWYVSHCGHGQGGLYLAPLYWNDGLDDADTSIPIPKEFR